jgi:hypothetical protein
MPESVVYVASNWETPFNTNPHTTSGRYHDVDSLPTTYCYEHPLGPSAAYLRDMADAGVDGAMLRAVRLRIWVARLRLDDKSVLEVSFDTAADVGLTPAQLVGNDDAAVTACRRAAQVHARSGTDGAIWVVPSPALPGTRDVIIFGARYPRAYQEPIEPEDDQRLIPSSVLAERAQPPEELLEHVRFHGPRDQAHRALEAWESQPRGTDPYGMSVFQEPTFHPCPQHAMRDLTGAPARRRGRPPKARPAGPV